jgi:hypothetical protein
VLVDLDLAHPCIAAYVAADILRNLAMLTRNEPGSPEHWRQALDGELQALDGRCPQAQLLLAIPDSSRGAAISAPFFERALPALQEGAGDGHIFIDLGGDLLRPDAATQRAALLAADQILLVARADSVSLWQAREAAAAGVGAKAHTLEGLKSGAVKMGLAGVAVGVLTAMGLRRRRRPHD